MPQTSHAPPLSYTRRRIPRSRDERGAVTSVPRRRRPPAAVEAVADVLAEHGIEVAGRARDGNDAVEQIEQKPTVAILDLRMPGQSGIEGPAGGEDGPGTSVILYTAFGDRAS